jgi:hypothetical protein
LRGLSVPRAPAARPLACFGCGRDLRALAARLLRLPDPPLTGIPQ